jgi:hypothetical protein
VILANWSDVSLRVRSAGDVANVVKRLRATVADPVTDLATAIQSGKPVFVRRLFGLDHDEAETAVLALLRDLEAMTLEVEILVAGETVTKQYLNNILERHRAISQDVAREMDLESGDSSEETLRWAKGERLDEE